jgi:hypothetical protein
MIEPAAYGAAVSFGPHTHNFRDVAGMMLDSQAAQVVRDGEQMTAFVRRCLQEPQFVKEMGQRARQLVLQHRGAAERTCQLLGRLLAPARPELVFRQETERQSYSCPPMPKCPRSPTVINAMMPIKMKRICALTTVRNDQIFLRKWIEYYGAVLGKRACLLSWMATIKRLRRMPMGVNLLRLPHIPLERVPAMRRRARVMSNIARGLYFYFDVAIATDVDEFIVVDPQLGLDLRSYLSSRELPSSLSALGPGCGPASRSWKTVGSPCCVPGAATICACFLAIYQTLHYHPTVDLGLGNAPHQGANFRIDANLYLFHFGMIDYGWPPARPWMRTGWRLAGRASLAAREAI